VQTGKYFRSRPAALIAAFWLNSEVQPVEIGLTKAALLDLQQLGGLKLLEIGADAAVSGAHIFCKLDLAREAGVIVPCVFEKHGVGELGADGDVFLRENEIRDLGEAVARRGISADNFDVALFENIGDVARGAIVHTLSLYVACNAIFTGYPRFAGAR